MKNFKQILSKPSIEARPWIIWIWNLSITKHEMVEQLNELIAQGFGGIIIRPGKEMTPTFLSEEFFELFKVVLETAKEHGVGIRIGEDFSLPCGGYFAPFLEKTDTLRAQSLVLVETHVHTTKESFEYTTDDPKNTIIIAARLKGQQISLSEVKIIPLSPDKSVEWKVQSGEWKIFIFKKEYIRDLSGGYIPNMYNARTTQMYIQDVLTDFKNRFSKYFGTTFKGFLTEVPAYRTADNAIPWDDDLVKKFRTKYKKDLLKYFLALFHDAVLCGRIRNQLYSFFDQSAYERFALPLEIWAKKHHISQWVLCPERSIHRTNAPLMEGEFHADTELSSLGLQNLDGIDDSYPLFRSLADLNNNELKRTTLAVIGRNRTGRSGTLQSLKDEVDMCLMAGATQLIIDGAFYSLDQRSYLKTPHNPVWFPSTGGHFKQLCEYAGRMQELLKDISFSRPVAIYSTAPGIRATYNPANGEASRVGNQLLQKTIDAVIHQSLDFDIVSEEYLHACTIQEDGELGKIDRKGKGSYLVLVVPFAPLVSRSVLVFMEKLVAKRGIVLFVNDAPKGTLEDGINAGIASRVEKLLNPKKSNSRIVTPDELEQALSEIPSRCKVRMHDEESPDIACVSGIDQAGCEVYCIHNISERLEYLVKIEVPHEKRFVSIDCDTGNAMDIQEMQIEEGLCRFGLHLMPRRTVLFIGSPNPLPLQTVKPAKDAIQPFGATLRNYRIVLKNQWSFETLTSNALPLSNWNLRIGLSRESGGFSHFYESYFQVGTLPEECFFAMGGVTGSNAKMPGAEGQIEISINGTRIDRPTAAAVTPLPLQPAPVPAPPAAAAPPAPAPAPAPAPPVTQIAQQPPSPIPSLSQIPPAPEDDTASIDKKMEKVTTIVTPPDAATLSIPRHPTNAHNLFGGTATFYDIKNLLVKGFNRIAIRTSSVAADPRVLLYPPVILGSFSIIKGSNGWVIEKEGAATVGNDSWTKYGYPYLSGIGVYRQLFEIPHQYSRLILRMSLVSGAVDIKVNGKPVGKFLWQPIEADITDMCEAKRNELVITVTNTIDNILRMNGRPSGILGDTYIDVV